MRERTLFIEALEIAQPAERTAYLDRACADDVSLRARVEELLEAHEAPGRFMDRPAAELDGSTAGPFFSASAALSATQVALSPAIAGYEILEELGRGGMGVVYKARHSRLKRIVALKMLLAGPHAGEDQRARFRTEAEAVARLQHPNIVQIYEVGDAGACPFLALEFVDGGNLKGQLAGVPQPARQAAQLVETLARAIHYAHEHGVVHRDLKPGNILLSVVSSQLPVVREASAPPSLTSDDRQLTTTPKIADFGLAKQFATEALTAADLTVSGAILGSPCYMAPEQAAGKPGNVGPAADIYALGAILYELLSGRPPFQGETALDTLQQVKSQEPVPPSRLMPRLPRDLETICLKCLEKEPARRYPSAAALAEDLRRFQTDETILARPVGAVERSWRWSRRNPGWAAMLAALATLVLVIVVGTWGGVVRLQEALETSEINLDRAKTAERDVQKQYVDALIEQARANHRGRRSGQRFETLRLIEEASARRRDLGLPAARPGELANVAVAALSMPDLFPAAKWTGYPAGSTYVAFDDSLSLYARGDPQGKCTVCRLENGKEVVVHQLPGLGTPAAVYSPRLSGDARFVAVLYKNGAMQLWKLDGPRPLVWFESPKTTARHHLGPSLDFGADNRQAVFAHLDGRLTHYDLNQRTQCSFAATDLNTEVKVAIHPCQALVAVSSYYSAAVEVRDLRRGGVRNTLMHLAGVHSCAWHPSGQTLATAAADGVIRFFDTQNGRLIRHFGLGLGGARLRFNHRGDRLLVGDDWGGAVHLFDVASGQKLFTSPHDVFSVNLRFSPDDRRLAGGFDGDQLLIWRVGDGREYRTLTRHLMPATAAYTRAAVHADGRLLAVAMTDGVGFWDLATGEELRFLATSWLASVTFEPGPEGGLLLAARNGVLRCSIRPCTPGSACVAPRYEIGRPKPLLNIGANDIAFSRDRRVMALASRVTLALPGVWLRQAAMPGKFRRLDPGEDIAGVSLSPEGRWLATSRHENLAVKIWDARSGQFVKQLPESGWGVRFSPDGRWLATSRRLWRVGTTLAGWSEGPQVGPNNGYFTFSPDSKLLALATKNGHIRLFDPETAEDVADLEDPELHSGTLTFSPDGTQLIATGAGVHVWDLRRIRAQLAARGLVTAGWTAMPGETPAKATARGIAMNAQHAPTIADACFHAGQALGTLGWHKAACWCYARTLRLAPDHGEARLERGAEHLRQRRWAEALADLDRAAELPTLRDTAVLYRSLAYLQLGRHGEADADRQLLRTAYADFADACARLGYLHAQKGDQLLAMVLVQAALHFQPNRPDLTNRLAWFLATGPERSRSTAAAVTLAENATKLRPAVWTYWNTLGVCYYRVGRFQDAVKALETSLQGSPGRADAYDLYFLAMCHHRLGDRDKARTLFQRARAWHEAHRGRLSTAQAAELRQFRAEAVRILSESPHFR